MVRYIPITVVIPTMGRDSIMTTLESINDSVDELIIVLNKNPKDARRKIEGIINAKHIRSKFRKVIIIELPKVHNSPANMGLYRARNDAALILDDDIIVDNHAIAKIYSTYKRKNSLVSGLVVYPPYSFWSRKLNQVWKNKLPMVYQYSAFRRFLWHIESYFTSKARIVNTTEVKEAYNPNMLFTKEVINQLKELEGHVFMNESLTNDHDLSLRLKALKIPVFFDTHSKVFHQPMGLIYDLKHAIFYGEQRARRKLKAFKENSQFLPKDERFSFFEVFVLPMKHLKRFDFAGGFYQLIWQLLIYLSFRYYQAKIKLQNK